MTNRTLTELTFRGMVVDLLEANGKILAQILEELQELNTGETSRPKPLKRKRKEGGANAG